MPFSSMGMRKIKRKWRVQTRNIPKSHWWYRPPLYRLATFLCHRKSQWKVDPHASNRTILNRGVIKSSDAPYLLTTQVSNCQTWLRKSNVDIVPGKNYKNKSCEITYESVFATIIFWFIIYILTKKTNFSSALNVTGNFSLAIFDHLIFRPRPHVRSQ